MIRNYARWPSNQSRYPLVTAVAMACLGIPVTSVASERVLSNCGRVCTERSRSLLSPQHVEQLTVLASEEARQNMWGLVFPFSPFSSLPSFPLEGGPLNPARESGERRNLVHFSFKIWHLVTKILIIFPRISLPNLVQFYSTHSFIQSKIFTNRYREYKQFKH